MSPSLTQYRPVHSASSSGTFSPPPSLPINGFSPVSSGTRINTPHAAQGYRSGSQRYPPSGYAAYPQHPQQLPPAKHKGTLAPGQVVIVGDQPVRIERYLSEGGFAHVYLTSSEKPIYPPIKGDKRGRWGEKGYTTHCLKRIAFQDESVWTDVKKEIAVMVCFRSGALAIASS
jgi:AP2-associated kinase